MKDHRRSPRIQARLYIGVAGIDAEPQLRRGDISLTGLFFETDQDIGSPGSVQYFTIQPFSRRRSVGVMGRVVRVMSVDDLWAGTGIAGVAIEFMADTDKKREELQAIVHEVTGSRLPRKAERKRGLQLLSFSSTGMTVQTPWPVSVGETIRLEVQAPSSGRRMWIQGLAQNVTPAAHHDGSEAYDVRVSFSADEQHRPRPDEVEVEGMSLTDAMSILLEETLVADAPDTGRPNRSLNGTLDRIPLVSLLGFAALEELSGELRVRHDGEELRVAIQNGRVVDARAGRPGSPVDLLDEAAHWSTGEFELFDERVDRPDAINMSTTELLAEIRRRHGQ